MGNSKKIRNLLLYKVFFCPLIFFYSSETCPIKSPFSLQQDHSGPSKKPPQLVLCQVVLSLSSQPSSGKVVSNVPKHISYLLLPLTQNYSIITSLAATPTSFSVFPCDHSVTFHNISCGLLMKAPPVASPHCIWLCPSVAPSLSSLKSPLFFLNGGILQTPSLLHIPYSILCPLTPLNSFLIHPQAFSYHLVPTRIFPELPTI